jgi:hypothetical protein
MLSILNSNQPVAWAFVPFSGVVLFLGSWALNLVELASWPALGAVCIAAWLVHRIHADSGMRTRPGSIPSWVWVLLATPMIGVVSDWTWWAFPCFLQGMRYVVSLRDGDQRPGTFMFIGMWWSAGVLIDAALWPLLPSLLLSLFFVRRPGEEESVAAFLGLAVPALLTWSVSWLMEGELRVFWGWRPAAHPAMLSAALWVSVPTVLGGVFRQQSLVRATAQQRFARQLTQWAGVLGVACIGALELAQWSSVRDHSPALSGFPGAVAFLAAWTWPWLMPPGKRWTKVAPLVFVILAAGLLAIRFSHRV